MAEIPRATIEAMEAPTSRGRAMSCWACGSEQPELEPEEPERPLGIAQGWSIRADKDVMACPEHKEFMPPHPKAGEVER